MCNKMSKKHATGEANINIVQSGTPLNVFAAAAALFELPSPFANGRSAASTTASSQDEKAITSFEVPPVAAAAVPRDGSSADDVQTDVVSIFVVPTKGVIDEKISEAVMIDTEHISVEALKKLKVQDPFLYYSIPAAVRNAAVRHREVDMSVLRNSGTSQSTQNSSSDTNRQAFLSLSSSSPVQVDSEPSSMTTSKVKRKSCISFECSPSLLFDEDFFDMVDQMRCVDVSDDVSEDESSP